MKAVQAARATGPPNDWDRWLTRVAVNACRDRRRAGWWRQFRWRTHSIDELELPDETKGPDRAAMDAELRERLWSAFRTLPSRQREVFALRQVEQWSTHEVAEALQITTGSVKQHLFRAIRHLRTALGGER